MIKVVGFDLDDTLWAVRPVIIQAEKELDAWLKNQAPDLIYDVTQMRQFRDHVLKSEPSLVTKITEFRRRIILHALEMSRISNAHEIADHAIEVFLQARNNIQFFDGALDALNHLSERHRLGALSNGNADIERLGLAHLFSFAYSAEQVGAPKPDAALFEHALAHTGVKPEEMIYVGDDPLLDVDAANQLGIKTIWLDHGTKPQGLTSATVTISNIAELPKAVLEINGD